MPKIVSRARQLRLDYQAKLGRPVAVQEVADQLGMSRVRLTNIELGKIERFDTEELERLCTFYSRVLGRFVGTGDVLEYDQITHRRTI